MLMDAIKRNSILADTLRPTVRAIRRSQWRRRSRRVIADYLRSHSVRKLHIGADGVSLDGWLNTDIRPAPHEAYLDAAQPFPFEDGSFQYITSEHVIEHLSYEEGLRMLRECRRILTPGGRVRIVTPDLRVYIDMFTGTVSDQQFLADKLAATQWPRTASRACMILNLQLREWGHQFIYDRVSLRESLAIAGFSNVGETVPGVSEDPNLNGVDARDQLPDRDLNAYESMVFEAWGKAD
jgi:predicted SAM-dependent methyltransferase